MSLEKEIPQGQYSPEQIQLAIKEAVSKSRDNDYVTLIFCYRSNRLYLLTETTLIRSFETVLLEIIEGVTTLKQKDKEIDFILNRTRRIFEKSNLKDK
jgi:hypothetical protein